MSEVDRSFVPPLSSPDSITVVLESFSIDLRINSEGAGAANKRQKGQTSGELHLALFRATQLQSARCMCVCLNTSDVFRGVSLPQKTYARAWWGVRRKYSVEPNRTEVNYKYKYYG